MMTISCKKGRIFFFSLLAITLLTTNLIYAEETERYSVKMAESIMTRAPYGYGNWDYVTGTVLRGMEEVWRVTGDERYFNYIKRTVDNVISDEGGIRDYKLSNYNIDEVKEGCQLLFLYKQTGDAKYKIAAETLRLQLQDHPRTTRGGFWHKKRYTNQMWLDGLYMGSPFYAEYSKVFGEEAGFDDVVLQITEIDTHTYDEAKKLHYHGWDEMHTQSWADPVTGRSESFWGRAIGWYAMAIVDVLDYLPQDHPERDSVLGIFNRIAEGIKLYQDTDTLVWWQVVDRGREVNNYIESSASCMFTYAIAKGVRLGYLDATEYRQVAIDGYQGLIDNFITTSSNGTINLTQTCTSAGLSDDRDGSYEYYTTGEPTRSNDGKGLGPFLLACIEIEMLDSIYPPGNLMVDSVNNEGIAVSWFDNSENETGFELERRIDGDWIKIADIPTGTTLFLDEDITSFTNYTYRVKAVNASGSSTYSNEIFTTTPDVSGVPWKATKPAPANWAENIALDTVLKWEKGDLTDSVNVYFGTTNPPPFVATTVASEYNPGGLLIDSTYFWRIDPINSIDTTKGDLWTFSTPLIDKMVGYWNFSEASGSIIADSSGFDNHGTWKNMSDENRVYGYREQALFFNGSNQYVEVPHNKVYDFSTGSFTMAFYLKQPAADINSGKEFRYVIKGSHSVDAGLGTTGKRYEVFTHTDKGEIRFSVDDNATKSVASIAALSLVMTDDWVHIAAVRDAENHRLNLYLDGNLLTYATDNTGDISQEESLYFGYAENISSYYHGKLDEVRLYNYAMNQADIQAILEDPIHDVSAKSLREGQDDIRLFPNPATNFVTIKVNQLHKNASVRIFELCGKEVFYSQIQNASTRLDLSSLQQGVYILQMQNGDQFKQQKLILH